MKPSRTLVPTTLSPDYAKNWSRVHAIREILQNALDLQTGYGVAVHLRWENGKATVEDEGSGLELRHLALGVSEKSADAIGQFGEGLKLAALIFAREHAFFEIQSRGVTMRPRIIDHEVLQTPVLAFELTFANGIPVKDRVKAHGTRCIFECSEEEFNKAKEYFAGLQTLDFLDSRISLPPGRIYINGGMVLETEALFSYHLTDKTATNRDRDVADLEKLSQQIGGLLSETKSPRVIHTLLKHLTSTEPLQTAPPLLERKLWWWGRQSPAHPALWMKELHRLYGPKIALASLAAADAQARYEGWQVLHATSGAFDLLIALGVKRTADLVPSETTYQRLNPVTDLTPQEVKVLTAAQRAVGRCFPGKSIQPVAVVANLHKDGQEVKGLWSETTKTIYLHRKLLSDRRDPELETTATLLEEMIHKVFGASDCSASFQRAATILGAYAMLRRNPGTKRPYW